MINTSIFFEEISKKLFKHTLTDPQRINISCCIEEFEKRGLKDLRFLAYILATIYHETGATMEPIEEIGKGRRKPYGMHLKYDNTVYTDTMNIFYGRGHTQNTWYENYKALTRAAKLIGKPELDFFNHPELLLQVEPSIWATFYSMIRGLYTGKRLSQYFNEKVDDPEGARWIINRQDKAKEISEYHRIFLSALKFSNDKV